MTLMPFWALRLFRAAMEASDWIDETFFPLPATPVERKQQHLKDVEDCGHMIRQKIQECKSLKAAYDLWDAVSDFKAIWGDTTQVNAWVDSLIVDLRNKETSIIQNL